MISSSIDVYLETLNGHIFDDDKLVTYKWLSKELGLHVNLSKQILWQFWKEHRKRNEVVATFALMGYLADGGLRVEVVKESDLPSAEKKFSRITAKHLYSLQRALPDIELLALSETGDHRYAAIICQEISQRKDEKFNFLQRDSTVGRPSPITSNSNTAKQPSENILVKVGTVQGKKVEQSIADGSEREDVKEANVSRGHKRQVPRELDDVGVKKQKREPEIAINPKTEGNRKQASLLNFFKKS